MLQGLRLLLIALGALAAFVAVIDAYQAITGRRVSKAPSRRDDRTMRRQSAVAAVMLAVLAIACISLGITG